ncbi:Imm51 family immunity protein [Mannheimia sp. AT1]|uniref:Imm51 family immunity protein n=1 Tax=Mannheimia cairinae TaxID=3025936 RepID=A0ABT5MM40_9PAST|nr:Imm51 family immunity protein [Mannheimia cairinae]MDD0823078.1 Imm51 family immunity protein [Mannheimia cairinae]MDD0825897.1 Imm51 family immunity protein [Mannheimia cairinae]
MSDYVKTELSEKFRTLSIELDLEDNRLFELGERINAEYEPAYMNGYNWAAFLRAYLSVYRPSLLELLEEDPEAGCYYATYPLSEKNKEKIRELKNIIVYLVEHEEEILNFIGEHLDNIEWD